MRHLLVLAMSIWALAAAADAAELAIVMAIDVSTSVTADSYILQRDGIARAFKDPRLIDAISAAPGGIEALVLEWSDPESIAVAVPWTHITDKRSAAAFAASVHAAARNSGGLTAIGQALAAAAAQFERLPQPAARRIIDISGDGIANIGAPPQAIRDRIVKAGITINGLAIVTEQPWLDGILPAQCDRRPRCVCTCRPRLSQLCRSDAEKTRDRDRGRRSARRAGLRYSRCGSARSR